ncbi:arylamine N-acetyltransferase [Streptomyces sp. AJS327]|uniref:arylamine N-acetyltransferase family protein n=1 Tax=Streptomyces sp. AJS327 TaxID=2545265 RepID=UPI0015DEE146|nr:arylamine N-acetyltransferase [Streptomyces sp. AJS327]MBA0054138.1 arylamine N-acetyltransferase [Streptomyces sp. AJS327]
MSEQSGTTSDSPSAIDLDAYAARIGWTGPHEASVETLSAVQYAHLLAIPFENLEPLGGAAPSLDVADLQSKLVHGGRGGYCYEHNSLLAAVFSALGFEVTTLAARVQVGARGAVRPRTHMCLLVRSPDTGTPYLADAGFGAPGALLEPVPLVPDTEHRQVGGRWRRLVCQEPSGKQPLERWTLQAYEEGDGWADQYLFTLEPYEAPDFNVINWYAATHPRSPFHHTPRVMRVLPDGYRLLTGDAVHRAREDVGLTVQDISATDATELRRMLTEEFTLTLPDEPLPFGPPPTS